MYSRIRNDECLICEDSLLKGIDLYHLLVDDILCYNCRKKLNTKLIITKFLGYRLISFYKYNQDVSRLIIRYKDLLDKPLANVFLKEWMWLINLLFKDYKLVLVPSSQALLNRRGFNHLEAILENCKLEIIDCLKKEDSIQRFSKTERKLKFKFKYIPHNLDKIIIFDDVVTSGNSLLAAIQLLAPISNKIILITIATNIKKKR